MNEKMNALSMFLEVEVNEITQECYNENVFSIGNQSYLVCTDEEASQEFREYQKEAIDDMGFEGFVEWAQEYIIYNFVDTEWFNEAMNAHYELYCQDIKEEEATDYEAYSNRLEEEIEEAGCETEEEYIEYLCNAYEDGVEYFIQNFGEKEFSMVVTEHNLIDWDEVIGWIEREDGRGCLASYDGTENEEAGYFIYRTN